ncbi:tail fiber protein [Brevibacillus nitrificans]|uniref:phage tail protein n=1 Tax=Brevibacillus nitrificans TaxID=651560 RepID=UPI0028639DF6|nr:tail fiber protein [Brevibacillus nitrificans]MDR7316994.1 microcystin-dependent protein [Brevibacillus nitrificans]
MGQPYVGEIRMFGGNFAPVGWEFCNGQLLSISENGTLYQLIGTTYGGDGVNTFALPDLRGRIPLHMGQLSGGADYVQGTMGGVETVTLTVNQIPSHTHIPIAESGAGADTPVGNTWAKQPQSGYSSSTTSLVNMNVNAIAPAGGSQPHENMMPSLTINFIISLYGTYPSQN